MGQLVFNILAVNNFCDNIRYFPTDFYIQENFEISHMNERKGRKKEETPQAECPRELIKITSEYIEVRLIIQFEQSLLNIF